MCKVVRYCGKVCQRQHWKKGGHRKICKPPLEHVDIDVATVSPSHRGQWLWSISSIDSSGHHGSQKPIRAEDLAARAATKSLDNVFLIKVQISPQMPFQQPAKIYDHTRKIDIFGFANNVVGGDTSWRRLVDAVRTRGISHPMMPSFNAKAYFKAYMVEARKGGPRLIGKVQPNPGW